MPSVKLQNLIIGLGVDIIVNGSRRKVKYEHGAEKNCCKSPIDTLPLIYKKGNGH
jgi:hypothetical protein